MALACVVGTSTRADAAFIAYICDDAACAGGNDTIITDNGPGDNFPGSALLGQINSGALSFNGFTIITNVSQSKPLIGSASAPQMDLTFSAVTNDNLSHTVFLYASDTGFTGTGTLLLTLGGTQSPAGDGNTIQGRAWAGTVNVNTADPRAIGPLLANTGASGATPFAISASGVVSPIVNPYGMAIGVQITRGSAGTTTGDLNVSVPEPASMALFGLGLMGFGAVNRRRKANRAK
jgi:hypothetical protein